MKDLEKAEIIKKDKGKGVAVISKEAPQKIIHNELDDDYESENDGSFYLKDGSDTESSDEDDSNSDQGSTGSQEWEQSDFERRTKAGSSSKSTGIDIYKEPKDLSNQLAEEVQGLFEEIQENQPIGDTDVVMAGGLRSGKLIVKRKLIDDYSLEIVGKGIGSSSGAGNSGIKKSKKL